MTTTEVSGKIDAASLAEARRHLGVQRPLRPWNTKVSKDTIWHFAMGLGDDNPLFNDAEYAKKTRWGGLIAPPTYLYSCTSGGPPAGSTESVDTDDLLPGVLGLWASDHWTWQAPAREGMELTATAELHSIEELPDNGRGPRVRQVDRHSFYGDGELLAVCDKTIMRFERSDSLNHRRMSEYVAPHYTETDRAEIAAQYEAEYRQRRGAEPLDGSAVVEGSSIGRLVKGPLTVTNVVGWLLGWGSFMCQSHRMQHSYVRAHPGAMLLDQSSGIEDVIEAPHLNSEMARATGMPAAYDFGGQRVSWLAHLVTDWCGDDGFLAELTVDILRPNYLGDTTWIDGAVLGSTRTDDGWRVECQLSATNQRGETTARGTAVVALPAAARDAAG
jgi:acyl dehydratase